MRAFNLTTDSAQLHWRRLARLTRADGVTLRIAEAEAAITVNGETFSPLLGCEIKDVEHVLGGDAPSSEISFAHSEGGTIDTAEVDAGLWDGAAAVLYVVDTASLTTLGEALFTGYVDTVTLDPVGGSATLELRGLAVRSESVVQTYQPMCRTDLGSVLCTVNLAALAKTGTIGSIVDRFNATISGMVSPPADGWFNGGVAVSASGISFEVSNWVLGTLTLTTYLPRCALFTVGEGITIYPGCDKTAATCKTKFSNMINFQGEPHFLGARSIVGT